VPSRECADDLAVSVCQCADCDDQSVVRATCERRNRRSNLADVPHDQGTQFDSEGRRHPLDCPHCSVSPANRDRAHGNSTAPAARCHRDHFTATYARHTITKKGPRGASAGALGPIRDWLGRSACAQIMRAHHCIGGDASPDIESSLSATKLPQRRRRRRGHGPLLSRYV
jgi:hypothetical protein